MSDWTSGYVADIGYTYGYYNELNPLRSRLALLSKGLVPPEFKNACEIGFGQGMSTNIHAAASTVRWYGTDFNPSQASYAQELSRAAGSNTTLSDESFAEFAARSDLPQFDFIGLHGIWSWISDDNRGVLVEFIRKRLAVGGVLYISYNTMPGWASFAPMRHLMTEHAEVIGAEGRGIVSRINDALEFADRLLATNASFGRQNPAVAERIAKLKTQNRHYLAHEYFNKDWHPMHFASMADWLKPAKLQFATSANYLDSIDALNLTADQQQFLSEIPDATFKESVRDFMVNQQFRRDYWVKGLRTLSAIEQVETIRREKLILTSPRANVSLKVNGALGEGSMSAEIYHPVLDVMADHKIKTFEQIERALESRGLLFPQLLQVMLVLIGAGYVQSAQDDNITKAAKKSAERLNQHLKLQARGSSDNNYLSSPVTGGGHGVGRFQQLFMLALEQGQRQPEELARFAWQILDRQGQKLLKDNRTLETPEENLGELLLQAKDFQDKTLPILKSLQIA